MNRRINFSAADADRWRALSRMAAGPAAPTDAPSDGGDWYRVTNETGDGEGRAVVDIYGEIGQWGVNASDFVAELRAITTGAIDLHISSGGGSVYEALAIYNALIDHPADVTVYVDSIAASAASFIAQAGDRIVMGRNAEMMIHDGLGMTMGNAELHREMADLLDKVSDNIASIYAARAGRVGVNVWRQRMKAETWYSAQEAVDAGLADEAAKTPKRSGATPKASVDLSRFNFAGRAEAPAPDLRDEVETSEPEEPTGEPEVGSVDPEPVIAGEVVGDGAENLLEPAAAGWERLAAVLNESGYWDRVRQEMSDLLNEAVSASKATSIDPASTDDSAVDELPAPPPAPPLPPPDDSEPDDGEPEPIAAEAPEPLALGATWTESISHLLDSNTEDGWSDTVHHLLSNTQPSPHGATKEAPCRP